MGSHLQKLELQRDPADQHTVWALTATVLLPGQEEKTLSHLSLVWTQDQCWRTRHWSFRWICPVIDPGQVVMPGEHGIISFLEKSCNNMLQQSSLPELYPLLDLSSFWAYWWLHVYRCQIFSIVFNRSQLFQAANMWDFQSFAFVKMTQFILML